MKITFLSPSLNMGGGTKVMAIYANYLVNQGHEVNVVSTPNTAIPGFKQRLKNVLKLQFTYPSVQASYFDQLNIHNHVIDAYRPIVDNDVPDADIVIATWWETAEWLQNLSPCKGEKVYFVQGHEIFNEIPKIRSIKTYQTDVTKIVVSTWLKETLEKEYQSVGIQLVPNAIDPKHFFIAKRPKNKTPTVGFLVGGSHVKGLDIALAVLAKLKIDYPSLKVISFGAHPQNNLPIDAQFEFFLQPSQAKIREIYASCDVWLASSRSEGFNLTAMEAMACGTPVVSTSTGWPVAAIKPYENGVLTQIDDVQALTSGVKWFLDLPDGAWQTCSLKANEATSGSSWDQSAAMFEAVLKDCALKNLKIEKVTND